MLQMHAYHEVSNFKYGSVIWKYFALTPICARPECGKALRTGTLVTQAAVAPLLFYTSNH